MLIDEAMRLEREHYLGLAPYASNPHRMGYANGHKSKTLRSGVGALELTVPRVRESASIRPR